MKRFLPALIGLFVPATAHAVSITQWWDCTGFLFCGDPMAIGPRILIGIVALIFNFLIPVAVVVFMYGGIRMIVSMGGEGKEIGKKAMIYAAMGLLMALLAGYITQFVFDLLYAI